MAQIRLPHNWSPRPYQQDLWRYLAGGGKRAVARWHRRSGKDDVFLHWTACAAFERVGNYWYCLPEYEQARKSMWDAVNPHSGKRRVDEVFPLDIRKTTREREMMIVFGNGSTFQLVGSDNYNALMGSPPVGIVFSEYALSNPTALGYLRPILLENGGWVGFNSTPRGNNHFKSLCRLAENDPGWFYQLRTVEDTGVFTREQLEGELREMRSEHGMDYGESLWRQEYFCSFDAAVLGSIYGREMARAEQEGRCGEFAVDESVPVNTAWDLGLRDDTAIWWYQVVRGEVHVIDFHASSGKTIDEYAQIITDRAKVTGYSYGLHYLPHDAKAKTLASGGKSIQEQLAAHFGWKALRIVPALRVQDGIQAARKMLPRTWFCEKACYEGMEALKQYRREYDDQKKKLSDNPVHDWTSHCFTGETEILTRYGMRQIMSLSNTGEVLTPCGWKAYRNPRITRRDAQLVEVRFTDGLTVRCTPDHLFLTTDKGWTSAESLRKGSQIQSSLTRLRSISMAGSIAFGQAISICRVAVRNCIEMFGLQHSGKYLMGATSTIATGTPEITISPISNACRQNFIFLKRGTGRKEANIFLKKLVQQPLNGISQMKEGFGIVGTQSVQKVGKNGSARNVTARTVGIYSWRLSEKAPTLKNIVQNVAGWVRTALAATTRKRRLVIEHVKPAGTADVWCLSVPNGEAFSLSNGAVVHNCADAFRMLAVAWRDEYAKEPPPPPKPKRWRFEAENDEEFDSWKVI